MFGPVFHLKPMGRLANLMIEYMVALKFADRVCDCRISNIALPAWGIVHPSITIQVAGQVAIELQEQHIDLPALADRVWTGQLRRIEWTGFRPAHGELPAAGTVSARLRVAIPAPRWVSGRNIWSVRSGRRTSCNGPNPEYVLTPVEFYRDIVDMTGLKPVFIGQTHPNTYMDRIRAAFPGAIFRDPQAHPLVDFETIRQSRNVVVGVSTYIWLAAWLSRSLDNIHLAVSGLFNPMQKPSVDLLPYGDTD